MSGAELKGPSGGGPVSSGLVLVEPAPIYACQFADRDRVSDFLKNSSALAGDAEQWKFGFADSAEYEYWAPRLCGVICLKMILDGHGSADDLSVAQLTSLAVALGGYLTVEVDGETIDKGWLYAPLVELAKSFGLDGDVVTSIDATDILSYVETGVTFVASVNPRLIRGDSPSPAGDSPGGHLVVVFGANRRGSTLEGFYLQNPSGRTRETQERAYVPLDDFKRAFAGRGFRIWATQKER